MKVRVKSKTKDIESVNRYSLSFKGLKSLGLGKTGSITVTARALLPSSKTELKIVMPELAAMKAAIQKHGNYKRIEIPISQKLPTKRKVISKLNIGQKLSEKIDISISLPGYYSIYAQVKLKDADNPKSKLNAGKSIINSTTEYFWIWVDEKGIKITKNFEAEFFPKGYRIQPGPFTRISENHGYIMYVKK